MQSQIKQREAKADKYENCLLAEQSKTKVLQNEKSKLNEEISKLTNDNKTMRYEVRRIQEDFSQKEKAFFDEIITLQVSHNQYKNDFEKLSTKNREQEMEMKDLNDALQVSEQQCQTTRVENSKMKGKLERNEIEKAESLRRLQKLECELRDCSNHKQLLEEDSKKTQQEASIYKSRLQVAEGEIAAHIEQLKFMKLDNSKLKDNLTQAANKEETLKAAFAELPKPVESKLREIEKKWNVELQSYEKLHEACLDKQAKYKKEFNESKTNRNQVDIKFQLDELADKEESTKANIDDITSEIEVMRSKRSELNDSKIENEHCIDEFNEKIRIADSHQSRHVNLQELPDDVQVHVKHANDLAVEIENLNTEMDAKVSYLEKMQQKLGEIKRQRHVLEEQFKNFQQVVDNITLKISEQEKKGVHLFEQLTTTKTKITNLQPVLFLFDEMKKLSSN